MCKILYSSRFAGCSYLMFFRLVVVPHMESRAWMRYGRLSLHKMFGTNPDVIPVSYHSRNRPQDMYSLDLYDGNYAKCKTPSSISAADMYCYCSQRLHKSSFPCVKILVPAISSLKTRRSSKNLTRTNYFLSRLVPSRTQFCKRPLELRTRLFRSA